LPAGEDWEAAHAARVASLRAAPEAGELDAQLARARALIAAEGRARDVLRGVEGLESVAARGSAEAMNELARLHREGVLVRQDDARAVALLESAAALGHAQALSLLGQRLLRGEGVALDEARGFACLERAAEGGDADAQTLLGVSCEEGRNGPPDADRALTLFERAAAAGQREALFRLGCLLEDGVVAEWDPVRAYALQVRAAAAGHVEAMYRAAQLAFSGRVPDTGDAIGRDWLKKAADAEHKQAQFDWADLHEHGKRGAPVQPGIADYYFLRAGSQGHSPDGIVEAWYRRGLLRLRRGGREHAEEAWADFRRAADRGHPGAIAQLRTLAPPIPFDEARHARGAMRWLVHELHDGDDALAWPERAARHREALAQARGYYEEIRDRAPTWSPWPELHPGESMNLYALSRLNDLMLCKLQGVAAGEPADPRYPDLAQYEAFWRGLGFSLAWPQAFHPFRCEVVEVEPRETDELALAGVLWPTVVLGATMFSRAGVRLRAPASRYTPGPARSTLYWCWNRRGRATADQSAGWGHNSQWSTDFRRDVELADRYAYNVDVRADGLDLADERLGPEELDGLSRAQRIELLRHRALTRPLLEDDHDLYPYRDFFDEPKPAR
ncbi:MAG TPA: hypothetical protein VIP05_09950, partial [Burkholderiaceae bacterium]